MKRLGPKYSALIFLVLLAAFLLINSFGDAKDYISLLVAITATFLGVFLALETNRIKTDEDHQKEFETSLIMLDLELEHNLSIIKKHKKKISRTSFDYGYLGTGLIDFLLDKSFTIKHGGQVFRQALLSCRTRLGSYLAVYDRFEKMMHSDAGLPEKAIDYISDQVDQTEYVIVLLRALIRKYQNDSGSLIDESTLSNYKLALALERRYRDENKKFLYEELYDVVAL